MKELGEILRLWDRARASGEEAVLATVVKTLGSSYRNPGARLMITASGVRAGSVSGGCLEEDLTKKAFWLTENGCTVRRYDTTPDGEIDSGGYGLGCNGTIYVLLERITPANSAVLDVIQDVLAQRRCGAIAHRIDSGHPGERVVLDASGRLGATGSGLESEIRTAREQLSSRTVSLSDGAEFFVEVVTPAPHLLVFGAGDDAVPLTRVAKLLGWRVSVFDGRAHYAHREKFPDADAVSVCPAGQSGMESRIDPWTVAVVMSHSYKQDLANLRELASYPLRYLGVLGPRKRTLQLLADASLNADSLIPALHGPMGLDIGADGAEQVALAVAAEIQAALNGREGGSLRGRSGAIHARESEDSERFSVQSIACA
jgi:xanthine/CO dehydrogenase XdhC/CoxF family maturation factor